VKGGLRVLAVVPARGGTDTVPYLNLKRLGDKPLLAHTLDAARRAPSLDRVVVSTDDDRLAEIAAAYGAEAPFRRPADLVRDIPSLKPVIEHAVRAVEAGGDRFDVVVVLQATSPFREAGAIEEALDRLVTGGFDAVISVDEDRTLSWRRRATAWYRCSRERGAARSRRPSTGRTAPWWCCGAR
jgi:CMP-N,N'-diacetyllegionaminic acid synthase